MKNILVIGFSIFLLVSCINTEKSKEVTESNSATTSTMDGKQNIETIYQFSVTDLNGKEFDFSSLKGKKILVVNTASECGYTPQYKDLQKLYDTYKDKNFVIVGFPANNFGQQEPGSDQEIAAFCEQNYGVTFPMMSKISVKGADMHPVYQFLTKKDKNGYADSEVGWNFQKYLLNAKGELEKIIDSKTLPTDQSVIDWIEK